MYIHWSAAFTNSKFPSGSYSQPGVLNYTTKPLKSSNFRLGELSQWKEIASDYFELSMLLLFIFIALTPCWSFYLVWSALVVSVGFKYHQIVLI